MFRRVCLAAAVVFACGTLLAPASADVTIYQDTFTGTAGTLLSAHAPDVASGLGGGSVVTGWTSVGGGTAFSLDGSGAAGRTSAAGGTTSLLPIDPEDGRVYTMSFDALTNTSSSNEEWVGGGFTSSDGVGGHVDTGYGWFISRSLDGVTTFTGLGTEGGTNYPTGYSSLPRKYLVVLDTTGEDWSVTWKTSNTDGSSLATIGSHTYSSNPTIAYAGVGGSSGFTGTFDNFTLTVDAIPEPSTFTLLAIGLVGLLAYAWKKRR